MFGTVNSKQIFRIFVNTTSSITKLNKSDNSGMSVKNLKLAASSVDFLSKITLMITVRLKG